MTSARSVGTDVRAPSHIRLASGPRLGYEGCVKQGLPFVPAQSQSFDVLSFGRTLVLVALVGLTVAGCGRRGPLEPPPGVKNGVEYPEDKETQAEADANSPVFNTAPGGRPAKASKAIVPPKRSFILDPLL